MDIQLSLAGKGPIQFQTGLPENFPGQKISGALAFSVYYFSRSNHAGINEFDLKINNFWYVGNLSNYFSKPISLMQNLLLH